MNREMAKVGVLLCVSGGVLSACSSYGTGERYALPPETVAGPQVFTQEPVIEYRFSGDETTSALDVETREEMKDLAGFFDPFTIDLDLQERARHAEWAPVYNALPPVDQAKARRHVDHAVELYGEAPQTLRSSGSSGDATLLDGLESLQRATFATEGADFDPCVSRDGKFLVYASTQHRPTSDIYMKSVSGTTITQLTADPAHELMPSLSPDGGRIAFASNRNGSWDIFVMSSEGGQAAVLTNTSAHELHPSWSPDGSQLVFCRLGEVSGRWEMWVMDVDQPVVSEFIGYGLFPEWCPRSGTGLAGRDKILFQRSRERGDRRFSIWTIDYRRDDASSPTEVMASDRAAIINPTWSFDGDRIAFSVVPNPASSGMAPDARPVYADIQMIDADGSNRVDMTKGRFVNVMPSFAPGGRIYFVSDREGVDNIWSIGTDKAVLAATGQRPTPNIETAEVDTGP